MKKYYLLFVLFFATINTFVQAQQNVGIGATAFTPSANSMLEVKATDAGVLIPRMTAAQRILINPAVSPPGDDYGLLVYQTDGGTDAGYWYWDGTAWTRLFNGTASGWLLTGNALTGGSSITPNEWIGSSNLYDWVIKTNNTERMRILSTGEVGMNTTPVASTQLKVSKTAAAAGYAIYATTTGAGAGTDNYGGYFSASGESTNYGLFSEVTGATGANYGIYGRNTSTFGGNQYGIYGYRSGIAGGGSSYGIYGEDASTGGGMHYGIYAAKSGAVSGYGLYVSSTGATALASYGAYVYATGSTNTNYGGVFFVDGTGSTDRALTATNNSTGGGLGQYAINCSKVGVSATGTGSGYGISASASGATGTNYGGSFSANDGTTNNYGVYSTTSASGGYGVFGQNAYVGAVAGNQYGVYGQKSGSATNAASVGYAVYGDVTANSTPTNYAVYGTNSATGATAQYGVYGTKLGAMGGGSGYGVYGNASGAATNNYGSYATATGGITNNYGVYGTATGTPSSNYGLYGSASGSATSNNYGSYNTASGAVSTNYGTYSRVTGTDAVSNYGVFASNQCGGGSGAIQYGISGNKTGNIGTAAGSYGFGVYGSAGGTAQVNNGVYGTAGGASTNYGVNGLVTDNANNNIAVNGYNSASSVGGWQYGAEFNKVGNMTGGTGIAVRISAVGTATNNYGIYGDVQGASTNYAAYITSSDYGIHGESYGTGGLNYWGVRGYKSSNAGAGSYSSGVFGSATGGGGGNYGGQFQAGGATNANYAVFANASGTGQTAGIMSTTNGTGTNNYGVYAQATGAGTNNYGGYFTATGAGTNYPLFVEIPNDNPNGITARINVADASVTGIDYFMTFRSTSTLLGYIAGTGISGQLIYQNFAGGHTSFIDDRVGLEKNMLVEATGDKFDTTQGQLVKARICSTRKSKAIYGVWGGVNNEGRDQIIAIGTSYIWVANKGQDIEIGDYLMSSDVKGCAEKQDDDFYHNYTAARAQEPIKWKEGEKKRLIACILLGG